MLNTKNIAIVLLLTSTLVSAQYLHTSDNINNLEIVTDADCARGQNQADAEPKAATKEKVAGELKVETVNYKLHLCDGEVSFPVTVRSHKLQGSNQ